jgi:hypothetical protein
MYGFESAKTDDGEVRRKQKRDKLKRGGNMEVPAKARKIRE